MTLIAEHDTEYIKTKQVKQLTTGINTTKQNVDKALLKAATPLDIKNLEDLDSVKGIGEKTKTALLKEFKSVKRIKEASFEEIVAIIGEAKAKTVKEGLSNESSKNE